MPDQRLVAQSAGPQPDTALGAIIETDLTASLQVADPEVRAKLELVRVALTATLNQLTAAADALALAANVNSTTPVELDGTTLYGTALAVASETETVIASLVVPIGQRFRVAGFTASGTTDGFYRMYMGTEIVLLDRTSAADPTARPRVPDQCLPSATPSMTVKVTVVHSRPNAQDFEAVIHGLMTL